MNPHRKKTVSILKWDSIIHLLSSYHCRLQWSVHLPQVCRSQRPRSLSLKKSHDAVIKWKHFPRYWPFVRGNHRSPMNFPHNGPWRGALVFSLICSWINGKQWSGSWFETPSRPLWRHCNDQMSTNNNLCYRWCLTETAMNDMAVAFCHVVIKIWIFPVHLMFNSTTYSSASYIIIMTTSSNKPFPRHWPFERGIHRSSVNSLHKGQWRGALMFSLICAWTNGWDNRDAVDLRRHCGHYDVTLMFCMYCFSLKKYQHVDLR